MLKTRAALSMVVVAALTAVLAPFARTRAQVPAPVIERIEPSSGPPGTLLRVTGRHFETGATAAVGGKAITIEECQPSLLTARVGEGVQSGFVAVQTASGKALGPEFVVTAKPPAPVIERIEPLRGAAGSEVTLHGQHFSLRLAEDVVRFGELPAIVSSASPTELRVRVPEGAITGPIALRVTPAGETKSPIAFEVTWSASVVEVTPPIAGPGSKVVISGTGFSKEAKQNRVYLNNKPAEVLTASETSLTVMLPRTAVSGKLIVDIKGGGRASLKTDYAIQQPPNVIGFSPISGGPGTRIELRGVAFGEDVSAIEAKIGESTAKVVEAKRSQLSIVVPDAAITGRVSVLVNGVGPAWSEHVFTVLPKLALSGFAPKAGPVGSIVVIEGSGFATDKAQNHVSLAGHATEVTAATPSRLSVRVPAGQSGLFSVTVDGNGKLDSLSPFVVTEPPHITKLSSARAGLGADFTIEGSGFGTNPSLLVVTLGNAQLNVRSVTDTRLIVSLPKTKAKGKIVVNVALQGSASSEHDVEVSD